VIAQLLHAQANGKTSKNTPPQQMSSYIPNIW